MSVTNAMSVFRLKYNHFVMSVRGHTVVNWKNGRHDFRPVLCVTHYNYHQYTAAWCHIFIMYETFGDVSQKADT